MRRVKLPIDSGRNSLTDRSTEYPLADDPLWFKDVVFYEVHVRTFSDSNADGVGDFNGLTGKLDYLQDLGVTAIRVLPFYPIAVARRRLRHYRLPNDQPCLWDDGRFPPVSAPGPSAWDEGLSRNW